MGKGSRPFRLRFFHFERSVPEGSHNQFYGSLRFESTFVVSRHRGRHGVIQTGQYILGGRFGVAAAGFFIGVYLVVYRDKRHRQNHQLVAQRFLVDSTFAFFVRGFAGFAQTEFGISVSVRFIGVYDGVGVLDNSGHSPAIWRHPLKRQMGERQKTPQELKPVGAAERA